ncbi:hypothetical protein GCM10027445_08420 [Amycolatopsis endophytica]|uniref:ABC-type transport system involved in multi-copper enzyme maturation permease subunit n=1 Tax=Amycolatopsis endophytica TaxID=860233 RepID=A0A853AWW2_9PSEU|nr:DUF4383 domain-containing protein [Amycolatopsis endophytica]NYI87081.1 ABC-type transport system involved in multi-copper enzyme maturation permease subunit [Amycolatopsis endophytica]
MSRTEHARVRVAGFQPVQVLAGLVGLVYLALGIVGFVRTGFGDFTGNQDHMVLGFLVNPLHNLIHIVVGVVGLLFAASSASARTFGWILFIGFGLVGIWGLMITGVISSNPVSGLGNPLNLNAADNWLHLVTAVLGLVMAIMPARKKAHVETDEPADTAVQQPVTTGDTVVGNADVPTRPVPQQTAAAPAGHHRPSRWKIHRPGRAAH